MRSAATVSFIGIDEPCATVFLEAFEVVAIVVEAFEVVAIVVEALELEGVFAEGAIGATLFAIAVDPDGEGSGFGESNQNAIPRTVSDASVEPMMRRRERRERSSSTCAMVDASEICGSSWARLARRFDGCSCSVITT